MGGDHLTFPLLNWYHINNTQGSDCDIGLASKYLLIIQAKSLNRNEQIKSDLGPHTYASVSR